jgi:hypothetical protein
MSITIDRKVVLDLLGKARTGNDLLSVLDMIATTFTVSDSLSSPLEPATDKVEVDEYGYPLELGDFYAS